MGRSLTKQQVTNRIATATKVEGIFSQDKFREAVEAGIPANIVGEQRTILAQRIIRATYNQLRTNERLQDCTPYSIANAALEAAELKLEIDNVTGQCYLIPYYNRSKEAYECALQIGYKGLIELARRSGTIKSIVANVVCENDLFDRTECPPELIHKIEREPRGAITHCYAWAKLSNDEIQFECWPWHQVIEHRDKHATKPKYGEWVWETHTNWMARKTLLVQLCKLLPVSLECQQVVAKQEYQDVYAKRAPTVVDSITQPEHPVEAPQPPPYALAEQKEDDPQFSIKLGHARWGRGDTAFDAALDGMKKAANADQIGIVMEYAKGHQDFSDDMKETLAKAREDRLNQLMAQDAEQHEKQVV